MKVIHLVDLLASAPADAEVWIGLNSVCVDDEGFDLRNVEGKAMYLDHAEGRVILMGEEE